MSDPKDLPLDWFKEKQFKKLSSVKNVAKTHWLHMTNRELFYRIKDEVGELDNAIANKKRKEIIDECVDVANFAAMLAHKVKESQ